ncbi:related to protein urg3 [Armillaria ostoyae]|uniref:Related to protein urg3 n=1 Tax=Armillaria ostoyae TaxID=47428 RepID=A0A284RMT2_ARMOS|nr:related to protein urg3 [Armillaria ostoyae]
MNISADLSLPQQAQYLRTLPAVRERCGRVFDLAKQGKLQYLDYHADKEGVITEFCSGIIARDFGTNYDKVPPHGRISHCNIGRDRVTPLLQQWTASVDTKEACKRLVDLLVTSTLLDAGAGKDWAYTEQSTGERYSRSEGLAVCCLHMFTEGYFSSDPEQPHQVDAEALSKVTVDSMAKHMQVDATNPLVGLDGRTSLLINLSKALTARSKFFGPDGRPGNMLDFLESESIVEGSIRKVPLAALWQVLIDGLNPVWPASRTTLAGVSLGDVWPCPALKSTTSAEADDLVPFHKLTQWMTYSVIEAIETVMKWDIVGKEDMTGLPEYRNGGLLIDLGVVTLKPGILPTDPVSLLPKAAASHPAVVEWRALTVIILDRIADNIRAKLGLKPEELNLAQVLEGATWKGGREIAKQRRPESGGPPLDIESDGTVF